MRGKEKMQEFLSLADVEINGNRPWDVQVHDERAYNRVLAHGSLGLGESYMDGWWDVEDLSGFLTKLLCARMDRKVLPRSFIAHVLYAKLKNMQNRISSRRVAKVHYDVGNELYERMLDKRMTYTCGYWKNAKTLDEAQEAKLDLICRKIGLKKGDRVLDIGGGWGSFAGFAAEKYGAEVVGITISEEQAALGRKCMQGLPVEIRLQDYRDTNDGPYDHIVSMGMFEHVGPKNHRTYMQKAKELLKDDGFLLLHTIGNKKSRVVGDLWLEKYIFPNSVLPSVAQVGSAIDDLFVMEDWHNFGVDYDTTLMAWLKNFEESWDEIKYVYDERFYRMWCYYLSLSAATFRSRTTQLWQIVLSPRGVPGGYTPVR